MSTTSVGAAQAQPLDAVFRQLVDRIDQDRDGQTSADEFGSLLTELIRRESAGDARPTSATIQP